MLTYRSNISQQDISSLATRLRAGDVAEIAAASGETPLLGLMHSVLASVESHCAEEDGAVIAMWGVAAAAPGVGSPWMLASPEVLKYGVRLVRDCRTSVDRWSAQFPVLLNYVSEENQSVIPWLKALGFTVGPLLPYGVGRKPFHIFYRTNHV